MQAQACRVEPTALMNPVLLKPGGERSSQVVLLGKPVGEMSARATTAGGSGSCSAQCSTVWPSCGARMTR